MQNIVTLGEINDALKIAAVTAAQLADMGFAALANKPICEGLPPEESRRLRNAKLYPAESIGQIRVALAQRLAAPAHVQEICPTFAVHAGDSKVTLHFSSEAEALEFYRTAKFDAGNPGNKTPEATHSDVQKSDNKTHQAAPDERKDLVPGVMRCAKCEFQLVRQVLAVNLGEVFAGDSKTEPCPNHCGPLWPVTWKQYAQQAMDAAESMADRAFAAEKEVKQLRGELSALDAPNLRAKIMSTPLGLYGTGIGDIGIAFRAGHRAALLTAADLVASTVVAAPAAVAVPANLPTGDEIRAIARSVSTSSSDSPSSSEYVMAGYRAALAAAPAAAPILISSLQSILADADVGPPTDSQWCCKECGRWTPWHHPEAHDHEEGCTAPSEYAKRRDWKSRLSTLIAATPTATAPAHPAEGVHVNAVGSIYVTAGGDREFDDWRVQLPIGNNLLDAAPVPADAPATATGLPAQAVKLLAPDHSGMKVDYRGLFSQVQRAIKRTDPGYAEMIRQLESHLQELGQRWYAGDTNVVDEILQLYCIERDARKTVRQDAAAAPQAQADARDADGMYYLQDARWSAMVGNCPSFWRLGGGYTTSLDDAERFTLEAAMKQHKCRETDLPWLCSELDSLRRPTIDCQYMPRSWDDQRAAIAAQAAQQGGGDGAQ